jgi:hypothetical protein
MARILDGNAIARQIREELSTRIDTFRSRSGRPPGLGIVLVGHDPASEIYVRNKVRLGTEHGLFVDLIRLPETASLHELLVAVRELNGSAIHDGILVQSPLPVAMGSQAEVTVFETIAPEKDVDGFSPVNVGRLVQNRATLKSCTPAGVIEILVRSEIEIAGKHAVVIGRSGYPGRGAGSSRLRDAGVRQAGRHGDRRRDHVGDGSCLRRRDPCTRFTAPRGLRQESVVDLLRCPSERRDGGRSHDAGAGRRRAADHRYADAQRAGRGGISAGVIRYQLVPRPGQVSPSPSILALDPSKPRVAPAPAWRGR